MGWRVRGSALIRAADPLQKLMEPSRRHRCTQDSLPAGRSDPLADVRGSRLIISRRPSMLGSWKTSHIESGRTSSSQRDLVLVGRSAPARR